MDIEDWKSQMRRGTLEYFILLKIHKKTYYGDEILRSLKKYPIVNARDSPIYPLLRRLLNNDYLLARWQNSAEGLPPHKYYSLRPQGKEYLKAMNFEWKNLLTTMDARKGEK